MKRARPWLLVPVLFLAVSPIGAQADRAAGAQPPAQTAAAYRVGIEDVLEVVVWNEPELTREVIVRPDGHITLPLVNDLRAAGLTADQIRGAIVERLSQFIQEPSVTVIVSEINSFRVFVLGEVNAQGLQNFQRPTRLLHAIASAGGLTEYSKKEAVVLREEGGRERRIRVDLKKLLAGSVEEQNLYLKPNDTVIVF